MADANLRLKLESGASRVFNCLQLTRNLRERSALPSHAELPIADLFFGSRHLNNAILIKETNLASVFGRDPYDEKLPIRTKLFLPYNLDNPYEGGQSSFTDDTKFEEALAYLAGAGGGSAEVFQQDLAKIRLIEQLPSLDPFLLKDKFQLAGLATDDTYFRLSGEEWSNIRAHIRERFVLMSRFASQSEGEVPREVVDRLVDRIWEARDLEPVFPLLKALGLPTDKAAEFFQCWKGISFFEYEFSRNSERVRGFSNWLQVARPRGFIHRTDSETLEQDRAHVRGQLRTMLGETLGIFKEFDDAFDQLFRRRESARAFSRFMLDSRRHFWRLGHNLNGIYHGVSLWDRVTERLPERVLPPAPMVRLMRVLREIF